MRVPARIPLVLVLASVGLLLGFGPASEEGLGATLFRAAAEPLCVHVDGQPTVQGTIGGNLLPGESVKGSLDVEHCDGTPAALLDLDIDFRTEVLDADPPAAVDLPHFLVAVELSYGDDDLLRDDPLDPDDRNVTWEIDANPALGNGDGRVSLAELEAGIPDLPAPGPPDRPTRFALAVRLVEDAGNALQADRADLTLVFFLADRTNPDGT